MKRRTLLITGAITGAALVGGIALLSGLTYNVEITKAQIEEKLKEYFPIEKSALVFSLKLQNPEVILENGSDRLKFGMDAELGSPFQDDPAPGKAIISGKIRYERDTGEFFFDDAKIEKFDVPGIPFDKFDGMANDMLSNFLESQALYKLDTNDIRQAIFKYTLRKIEIRDQKLILQMGLGL
jgi:hypothetical protein